MRVPRSPFLSLSLLGLAACASGGTSVGDSSTQAAADAGSLDAAPAEDSAAPADDSAAPVDAGPIGPAITVRTTETACADLTLPHPEPGYLFQLEVAGGTPNAAIEIWARKDACDVVPFLYQSLTLDGTGHGVFTASHPGNTNCNDTLLGHWTAWVVAGSEIGPDAQLTVSSSACPATATCASAAAFCPVLPDAGL